MKYLKLFENFESNSELLGIKVIEADYWDRRGVFVLYTTTGDITFRCSGGADLSIDGDLSKISDTSITDIKDNFYEIELEFSNGEIIILSDETDGEGIEYEIVENEDDFSDEDSNEDDFSDEDSNIDLSIELENKLRTLSDDSQLTVDDFLEEFGVSPEHMTGFAWASILKNAEKYKSMSDEEFNKLYDEYKNSVNESLITEKNVATNSELWNQCKAWAKSKYDVWPSAYACGAAAKRYKSKGGKWKKKKSRKNKKK